MKVLVTGGTGYIGAHTVVELIDAGYEPVIVDNLSNSSVHVLEGIAAIAGVKPSFFQIDLCDQEKLQALFTEIKDVNAVIHFAASKAVGESVEYPGKYYRNNLLGLLNLTDMMKAFAIPYLVFSSSCTVYGQPEQLPVTESTPFQLATSPYGNTKQIGEEILKDQTLAVEKGLNCMSLRYFNPVGAHATAQIGELPLGTPNNLVPFMMQSAAGIRGPLRVFGNDYNTPDGTAIRDYIHVVDLAKAHIAGMEKLLSKYSGNSSYQALNIGTGKGYSVLEVIKTFEKVSEIPLNYEMTDRRPGDIEQIYADTQMANKALNWKAEKHLEDMLRDAWRWQQRLGQVKHNGYKFES